MRDIVNDVEKLSPPAWEAGIEISGDAADTPAGSSPPAWGGWVEIYHGVAGFACSTGRSSHGERGLRCLTLYLAYEL